MSLSSGICLFFLCSFVGWAFESVHAIVKLGAWERRGFLYTPICPIYGVGVVGIILLVEFVDSEFSISLPWWLVFLLSTVTSAILEYATSWALEKLFHAKWWDYSDMPLNVNGRICLPASLLFGAGGVASIYVVYPLWSQLATVAPPVVIEVLAFVIVILLSADTTLTVSALTNFSARVAQLDKDINAELETLVNKALNDPQGLTSDLKKNVEEALQRARLTNGLSSSHRAAIARVKSFQSSILNTAKTKLEQVINR